MPLAKLPRRVSRDVNEHIIRPEREVFLYRSTRALVSFQATEGIAVQKSAGGLDQERVTVRRRDGRIGVY